MQYAKFPLFLAVLALIVAVYPLPLAQAQDGDGELPTDVLLEAAGQGAEWLVTQQQADGGFGDGFSEGSVPGATADVAFALAAVDIDPATVESSEGNTPIDYFESLLAASEDVDAGQLGKIVTALAAAGYDTSDFAGMNLVELLLASQDEEGVFVNDSGFIGHCIIMQALYNSGTDVPVSAVEALVAVQNEDGGWAFALDEVSDTNTTSYCVQALVPQESEMASDAIDRALSYFFAIQNEDNGWPYQNPSDFGTDSDSQSTALVAMAFLATEEDFGEWNAPAVYDLLLGFQNESGSFSFSSSFAGDNILATSTIVPALALTTYVDPGLLAEMGETESLDPGAGE